MVDNRLKRLLIGTIPPPAGGDATWGQQYLAFYKNKNIEVPLVNVSLTGKRAFNASDRISLFTEIKRAFRIWNSLKNKIKECHPSIVHFNINCSKLGTIRDYITAGILKRKKINFLVHCHCDISYQIGNSKLGRFFLKKLFKRADKVIVINSESYKLSESICHGKSVYIPNFISNASIISNKSISARIKRIVYVGHVKKSKGIYELLSSTVSFPDIQFVIVGPIDDEFLEYSASFKMKNVVFLGSLTHEKVIECLDNSDVFLFPSYSEGFSISLVEAMARGLPCIATDVGSNCDMIENEGGIIVETKNPNAIIDAIKKIEDYELRKRMSLWNIEKVKKAYQIESVIDRIEEVYGEIVNESVK